MARPGRVRDAAPRHRGRHLSGGTTEGPAGPDDQPPGAVEPSPQEHRKVRHALDRIADQHDEFVPLGEAPVWLRPLLRFARGVDRLNERLGRAMAYLVVAVVLIGFANAVLRYVGKFTGQQLTSNRYLELQWYLYATIFLLAFGYILKNGINVRVDFWYADRSPRTKAWIDFVGHLIALIPFCVLALRVTWGPLLTSWGARPDGSFTTAQVWRIWERSPDPGGLPRAPIKTVLLIGFVLLLAQALAEMVKLAAELTGHGVHVRRVAQGSGAARIE